LSPACTLILYILGLKQHLPCQCLQKSSFHALITGKSAEIINFPTWAWSWSWTWQSLVNPGIWWLCLYQQILL